MGRIQARRECGAGGEADVCARESREDGGDVPRESRFRMRPSRPWTSSSLPWLRLIRRADWIASL